ncbi:MAG: hypothetical protein GY754_21130 [bacterium]|nr:hypothetical protein [bacterium]
MNKVLHKGVASGIRKKPVATRIGLIFLFLFLCLSASQAAAVKQLTLVYTNSLNGSFDFCDCKEEPNGGLVKRAAEIRKIRQQHGAVLLFETGDFFLYDRDPLLAKYLIASYKLIGYDAVLFGDQEFTVGVKGFIKYRSSLPFVCNNILIKSRGRFRRLFKRSVIITKKGVKIGVIGTISKEAFRYSSKKITRSVRVTGQAREIRRDIRALRKKGAQIIVLLSHSGYEQDRRLAKTIRGIDVIVGGHSQTLIKKPERVGRAIIVQAGSNGARIGILKLSLKGNSIVSFENSFSRPHQFKPRDDAAIRKLIDAYKKESKAKMKKLRFD